MWSIPGKIKDIADSNDGIVVIMDDYRVFLLNYSNAKLVEISNMPYKSKAQEKFFNVNRKKLEKEGVNVNEWNKSSKGKKLPEKVKKGKKK